MGRDAMMERSRAVFAVIRHAEGWAVEHEGAILDPCQVLEEAVASASRRARASSEEGHPARVLLPGEVGFNFRQ